MSIKPKYRSGITATICNAPNGTLLTPELVKELKVLWEAGGGKKLNDEIAFPIIEKHQPK